MYRPFSPSLKPDPIDLDVSCGRTFRISRKRARYHIAISSANGNRILERQGEGPGRERGEKWDVSNERLSGNFHRSEIWEKRHVKYILPRGRKLRFRDIAARSSSAILVNPGRECSATARLPLSGNTGRCRGKRSKSWKKEIRSGWHSGIHGIWEESEDLHRRNVKINENRPEKRNRYKVRETRTELQVRDNRCRRYFHARGRWCRIYRYCIETKNLTECVMAY